MSFLNALRERLIQTRRKLGDNIRRVLALHPVVDESLYTELEEALISADVGVSTTDAILTGLRQKVKEAASGEVDVHELLTETIVEMMQSSTSSSELNLTARPAVILIVGVNGSGKTTTIAKLTQYFQKQGRRVLLAAADTFRAAASEQLIVWGDRLGVPVIHQKPGADPAAVAFDALQAAKARGFDLLIVDTAGRLHNKANLMQELKKIIRVMKKLDPEAPHEILLVLDANTGQNMIQQSRVFQEICGVTGLVLSKLDGTARGGAAIAACCELRLPLRFIGLGEKPEDLNHFQPVEFARAILDESGDRV